MLVHKLLDRYKLVIVKHLISRCNYPHFSWTTLRCSWSWLNDRNTRLDRCNWLAILLYTLQLLHNRCWLSLSWVTRLSSLRYLQPSWSLATWLINIFNLLNFLAEQLFFVLDICHFLFQHCYFLPQLGIRLSVDRLGNIKLRYFILEPVSESFIINKNSVLDGAELLNMWKKDPVLKLRVEQL